jgi:hypothetical protein
MDIEEHSPIFLIMTFSLSFLSTAGVLATNNIFYVPENAHWPITIGFIVATSTTLAVGKVFLGKGHRPMDSNTLPSLHFRPAPPRSPVRHKGPKRMSRGEIERLSFNKYE